MGCRAGGSDLHFTPLHLGMLEARGWVGSHCCCSLWWQQHPKPHSSAAGRAGGGSQAAAAPEAPRRTPQAKGGCGQPKVAVSQGFPQTPALVTVPHLSLASQSPTPIPPLLLELAELLFFNLMQGERWTGRDKLLSPFPPHNPVPTMANH